MTFNIQVYVCMGLVVQSFKLVSNIAFVDSERILAKTALPTLVVVSRYHHNHFFHCKLETLNENYFPGPRPKRKFEVAVVVSQITPLRSER